MLAHDCKKESTDMAIHTRTTDAKGRVSLPKDFANATVIIEHLNETELRIRKARIVPEDELRFREENPTALSNEARDRFLQLLDNPPKPNATLRRAARRHGN
jgi:Protein of unknown function (DUF1778)